VHRTHGQEFTSHLVALSKSLQFTSDTKQYNLVPAKGVLCSLTSVWSCITDCGVPSYRLGGM